MAHYHGFLLFHPLGLFRLVSTARRYNQARRLALRQMRSLPWRDADEAMARQCVFLDDDCVFWTGEDYTI